MAQRNPSLPFPISVVDSTTGLRILADALILGLLAEWLLDVASWGMNLGMWAIVLAVAVEGFHRGRDVPPAWERRFLLGAGVVFAFGLAWHESQTLALLNTLAFLILVGIAATTTRVGRLTSSPLADYALNLGSAALASLASAPLLVLVDARWSDLPTHHAKGLALAIGRGVVLAIPLSVVFGALLASADPVFGQILDSLVRWNLSDVLARGAFVGMAAWLAGGYLRHLLAAQARVPRIPSSGGFLGIVELAIVLGTLDLMFLTFVVLQLHYFFGGAAFIQSSATLTYAEYARRGFFELVAVAALALPLLLVADWSLRRAASRAEVVFRGLALVMIALLGVMMFSAVQRMLLYQSQYGLTELRVYTTAFMGWIALLLAWFILTVLRGRRERFAFGALVTGLSILIVLNLINPNVLIVSTNLQRPNFDVAYNTSLGADAVPLLVDALPSLPSDQRRIVAGSLLRDWSPPSTLDWRTTNVARWIAWKMVGASEGELRRWSGEAENGPYILKARG